MSDGGSKRLSKSPAVKVGLQEKEKLTPAAVRGPRVVVSSLWLGHNAEKAPIKYHLIYCAPAVQPCDRPLLSIITS